MNGVRKAINRTRLSADLRRLFENEASRHPDWADVQNRLGLAFLQQGRLTEAESAFERALALNPRYGWAALNLAQCLALDGRRSRAMDALVRAPEPAPGAAAFVSAFVELLGGRANPADSRLLDLPADLAGRPEVLRLRAAFAAEGDPAEASALLAQARRDPEVAAFDLRPWDDPGGEASALLRLVPGLHDLWYEASTLEARMGVPEEAEISALRAYLHWGDPGRLWSQRGFLASVIGDTEAALAAFERAAAAAPGDPGPRIALAYHWSEAGELERARETLAAALERAPRYADLHHQMGLLERARGRAEEALECFHRAIEINPAYRLARHDVAASLFVLKRWDEARAAYHEILATGTVSSDVLLHLGEIEERTGHPDEAERRYHEALRLNPKEAFAHHRLGHIYQSRGDRTRAHRAWKQFIELCGDTERAAVVEALLAEDAE